MCIIRNLDITVRFGGDQCTVGQSAWEMMTFNEKRRWVFPLVPTSIAYAKSNGHFGKLRNSQIEVSQAQGDFGWNLSVRKVLRGAEKRLQSKMGSSKTSISEMRDAVRNTLLRAVNTISGCFGAGNDLWDLSDFGGLYNLESDLGYSQKGKKYGKYQKCSCFFGGGLVQLPNGNEKK